MDKNRIIAALNAIDDGEDAGNYHKEIQTLIALVHNAKDEDISAAWEFFRTVT